MSTRYVATISIPKKYIEEDADIKKLIEDEFYDEGEVIEPDYYSDIDGIVSYGSDQTHGDFEGLEEVLKRAKVPFDRWTEGTGSDGPVALLYRPETGCVYVDGCEGERTFSESKLRKIAKDCTSHEELGQKFQAFLNSLPVVMPLHTYA